MNVRGGVVLGVVCFFMSGMSGLGGFGGSSAEAALRALKIVGDSCESLASAPAGAAGVLKGSGFAFQHRGKAYVLSSETIVQSAAVGEDPAGGADGVGSDDPGSDEYCVIGAGVPTSASLVSSNWSNGLALFELTSLQPDSAWMELSSIHAPSSVASGKSVVIDAFPSDSNTVVSDRRGTILVPASDRHFIPGLARATEIQRAHVESGMVGGAVYGVDGEWLGVLLHQYLKLIPGRATRAYNWDQVPGHIENHVLMLPAPTALAWIEEALRDARAAQGRIIRKGDRLISGALAFEELCPPSGPDAPYEPGYPIGGADGVGAGGDSLNDKACKSKSGSMVTPSFSSGSIFFSPSQQEWHDQTVKALSGAKSAEVWFLFKRTAEGRLERSLFRSLGEFFLLSLKPEMHVMSELKGSMTPGPGLDVLRALVARVEAETLRLHDQPTTSDQRVFALLRRIYLFMKLLDSVQAGLVTVQDIDSLLSRTGEFGFAWTWLHWDMMGGKPLYEELQKLRAELARIRG